VSLEQYLVGNELDGVQRGDVLFTFRIENSTLYTKWGALNPDVSNSSDLRICFTKFPQEARITPEENQGIPTQSENLDLWIGKYDNVASLPIASADQPHSYNVISTLQIFKLNSNYYATVEDIGWMTQVHLLAKVSGNKNEIVISFEDYLPNNFLTVFSRGDVLVTLSMKNTELQTEWGALGYNEGSYYSKIS